MTLRVVPLTRPEANAVVAAIHRHHRPVHAHRFAIGVLAGDLVNGERLCGAAIAGNPVGGKAEKPYPSVLEVLRVATDGTRNACSILYAACARAAAAMGYLRIQTFILEDETGTSLRAAGWHFVGWTRPDTWDRRPGRKTPAHLTGPKQKWEKTLA